MQDLKEIVRSHGLRKIVMKYASFGMKEMVWRSWSIPHQLRLVQKFLSPLTLNTVDVERGPSGVRAQAIKSDGTPIEDFVFDSQPGAGAIGSRVLHCRNAPSPGATSSLAIAKIIADKMAEQFDLSNKCTAY